MTALIADYSACLTPQTDICASSSFKCCISTNQLDIQGLKFSCRPYTASQCSNWVSTPPPSSSSARYSSATTSTRSVTSRTTSLSIPITSSTRSSTNTKSSTVAPLVTSATPSPTPDVAPVDPNSKDVTFKSPFSTPTLDNNSLVLLGLFIGSAFIFTVFGLCIYYGSLWKRKKDMEQSVFNKDSQDQQEKDASRKSTRTMRNSTASKENIPKFPPGVYSPTTTTHHLQTFPLQMESLPPITNGTISAHQVLDANQILDYNGNYVYDSISNQYYIASRNDSFAREQEAEQLAIKSSSTQLASPLQQDTIFNNEPFDPTKD